MYAAHSDHELDSEYMRNALPQGKAVLRDLAGGWGTANPGRTLRAAKTVRATTQACPVRLLWTVRNEGD